ncbi:UbiA prenyltransferase family-domain-containing protein [Rostrohypoxylon terebratum]|nr:UbiA prenyltransferase family-domain-containing protein [Rostrohypoxylon terebratum]
MAPFYQVFIRLLRTTGHLMYSIWLFTWSDLQTTTFPDSLFGIMTALSFPLVLFWAWINQLAFNVGNQRQPKSIAEDTINKPWRPMPSGRLSVAQAKYAMILSYIGSFVVSSRIGGSRPSFFLAILGYLYNDYGFGDMNGIIRNIINALGFITFDAGALEVALNRPLRLTPGSHAVYGHNNFTVEKWLFLLLFVIYSTGHTQDMHDQEGDIVRNRSSLPLQLGDGVARYIIAAFMTMWGLLCPYFWQCNWTGYSVCGPLAFIIAYRSLRLRAVREDRLTFKLWNVWMISLYCLPLMAG